MPLNWRDFRGASLSPGAARTSGRAAGGISGAAAEIERKRRARLLATAMQQGKIKAEQLSPQDLKIAGPALDKLAPKAGSGIFGLGFSLDPIPGEKSLSGLAHNFGANVVDAAKGLPNAAASLARDLYHRNDPLYSEIRGGEKRVNMLEDLKKSYESQYLGVDQPGTSLWDRLYADPLGPALDVATIASLGAGGAVRAGNIMARRGVENPVNKWAVKPRENLSYDKRRAEGEQMVPFVAREFSQRPLRHVVQAGTDRLGKTIPFVQNLQRRLTGHGQQRLDSSIMNSVIQQNIGKHASPLVPLFARLSPVESQAAGLIAEGAITPERIAARRESVARALSNENPEGMNFSDFEGRVDPRLPESQLDMPEAEALAMNPERSEPLMEAMTAYQKYGQEEILPDIGEEKFQERAGASIQALREMGEKIDDAPQVSEEVATGHPFAGGMIAPQQVAKGFKPREPNWLTKFMGGRKETEFKRGRLEKLDPKSTSLQGTFMEPSFGFRPNPAPFLAGVGRPDARAFVDLVAKHQKDMIDRVWGEEQVNKMGLKDANGELVTEPGTMSAEAIANKYGANWVPVNPVYPLHFYENEKTMGGAIDDMKSAGFDFDSAEFKARIGAEAEETIISAEFAAKQMPVNIMPREYVKYAYDMERASRPFENRAGRMYARGLNAWRTATLALMPRWAVNTAVGSFILSAVKGVGLNPLRPGHEYTMAAKLKKAGLFDTPEAASVNLAHLTGMEMLSESAMAGYGVKIPFGSRKIMHRVQQSEDYFRRASFVQGLDKAAQRKMAESGAIISNLEKSKGPRTLEDYTDLIMNDPRAVRQAIEDVNRFSYNFATMGPFERRYVRQFIPFWGWYKFISGLTYRLPVDYPGRTNLMAHMGMLGSQRFEEEFGILPPWIKGSIPLGEKGGVLDYLSTMGLNPFSSQLNPAHPEGLLAGTLSMSQGSPLAQAGLQALGLDPMRGGTVPLSPESGVSPDFLSRLISTQRADRGEWPETDVTSEDAGWRFISSLLRAAPQGRMAERYLAGGRSTYPENIPFIHPRTMPTDPNNRSGDVAMDIISQMIGFSPKSYNLKDAQALMEKSVIDARRRNKKAQKKIERNKKK